MAGPGGACNGPAVLVAGPGEGQEGISSDGRVRAVCPRRPRLMGLVRGLWYRLTNPPPPPLDYHHPWFHPVPTHPALMPPEACAVGAGGLWPGGVSLALAGRRHNAAADRASGPASA